MLSVVSATRPIGGSYRREASTGFAGEKRGLHQIAHEIQHYRVLRLLNKVIATVKETHISSCCVTNGPL